MRKHSAKRSTTSCRSTGKKDLKAASYAGRGGAGSNGSCSFAQGRWHVTSTDGPGQGFDAGVPTRPIGVAPAVIALTAAVAFGAGDQYLPVAMAMSSHPGPYLFAVEVSKMSAPWLLVPFLAGAWQAGQRRAALVGLAAEQLAVLAYVVTIVSPMEGAHLTPRAFAFSLASQWSWFAGGLITGPLYGWLGHRWRVGRSAPVALLAALPILVEPAARWLAAGFGLGNVPWIHFQWPLDGGGVAAEFAEVVVGLLFTSIVIRAIARRRASATA